MKDGTDLGRQSQPCCHDSMTRGIADQDEIGTSLAKAAEYLSPATPVFQYPMWNRTQSFELELLAPCFIQTDLIAGEHQNLMPELLQACADVGAIPPNSRLPRIMCFVGGEGLGINQIAHALHRSVVRVHGSRQAGAAARRRISERTFSTAKVTPTRYSPVRSAAVPI